MQTQPSFSGLISKGLETILNQAIRLDDNQGDAFAPLEDQCLQLVLTDLNLSLACIFTQHGMSIAALEDTDNNAPFETSVSTSLAALLQLPKSGTLTPVEMSGNDTLGQQFVDALESIEIDWEEHLSHYTGDLVAFKIGHAVRSFGQTRSQSQSQVMDTFKEYLQFEINVLPTASQVQNFNEQVAQLEQTTAELERKFAALLQKRTDAQ